MASMDIRRDADGYVLECEHALGAPIEIVAAFLERAENLERISPPSMQLRIVTPLPLALRDGARIELDARVLGARVRWVSRIEGFVAGRGFSDVAERSPFARWTHRRELARVRGETMLRERVEYELPFGALGRVAHALFVRRALERIFEHRAARLRELFPRAAERGAVAAEGARA
jgi:ligand-binding SRPBCC domain-containing protein